MSTPKRLNNRPTHSPRPAHITFPHLARVDGSAHFSFGAPPTSPSPSPSTSLSTSYAQAHAHAPGPSALASLTGPIEVRLAAENPSHTTLEVLVRPLSNVPATQAKALAANVRSVLWPSVLGEMNPRTLIQIVVQVLSSSGAGAGARASVRRGGSGKGTRGVETETEMGVMAAVLNASTMALLNAGSVPMRGVVCAVAVGHLSGAEGTEGLVVDPDEADGLLDAEGCFAYMFTRDAAGEVHAKCAWANWRVIGSAAGTATGKGGVEVVGRAREVGERGAREVYAAVFESVERMQERVPGAVAAKGDMEMGEI